MPNPKKRLTRSRRDKRRAHDFLVAPTTVKCPNCSSLALPHHVCPSCGYYKNREVVAARD